MITEVVFQDDGRRIPPAVMLSALKFLVFALEQNLTGKDLIERKWSFLTTRIWGHRFT